MVHGVPSAADGRPRSKELLLLRWALLPRLLLSLMLRRRCAPCTIAAKSAPLTVRARDDS